MVEAGKKARNRHFGRNMITKESTKNQAETDYDITEDAACQRLVELYKWT